ncbi:MAG: zinc-binding dehydrogenase [Armatimonadetes bacterium]|nr:zinc-binding dehydrogenase [Armatimonadota bacterium]MDW8122741.1 zinc-binding dehydrogenase [Armatimonadota bacterium]
MNQCVVCEGPGRVVLQEEPLPSVGSETFLVQARLSAISTGTELTLFSGDYPPDSVWARLARYPLRLGYSHLGQVVQVGEGIQRVSLGDRVIGWKHHCRWVSYREDENWVKVPDDIPDEAAAVFALATIALNGVRRAKMQLGEKVMVFGLGPIGIFACQFARLSGARPVIGADLLPKRRQWAVDANAVDTTLDPSQPDFLSCVQKLTDGRLFDVVFEVTGNANAILQEVSVVRKQGRLILLSSPRQKIEFDFHDWCNWNSLTIIGAHNSSHPPHENPDDPWTQKRNIELYFDLVKRKEIHIAPLITHRFHWKEVPQVYPFLLNNRGETGIVLLDWSD